MKVSIITVCWNSLATIKEAMESVLAQDHPDIEYIVIDGGSTDGTVDLVKSYGSRIAKFVSERDGGIFQAMNKGISLASGDIVGLLNSDDALESQDCISAIARKFEETGADAVYGDLVQVRRNSGKVFRIWKAGNYDRSNFRLGWMPPHPTTYLKRDVYLKYGLFREDMVISNDYEILLRFLYVHNLKAAYVPKTIVRMRDGGNSRLSRIVRSNYEVFLSWRVNGLAPNPFMPFLKPLSKLKQVLLPMMGSGS